MGINKSGSFGEYLKKKRLEKGLSLEEIYSQTKLSSNVLSAIENELMEELPEEFIVRGFLKSFSEVVGADSEAVIKLYMEAKQDIKSEEFYERPEQKSYTLITIVFIILLVIIILGFVCIKIVTKTDSNENLRGENHIKHQYTLEAECIEDTVLKISTDNNSARIFSLSRGENIELKASEFDISIDNNCGVTFFLDDNPIENKGECGKPKKIILP